MPLFFWLGRLYDTHPFSCPSVNLSELVATRKHNVYLEECPKAIITGGQTDLILPCIGSEPLFRDL